MSRAGGRAGDPVPKRRGRPDVAARLWEHDRALAAGGLVLAGTDEVGRGPLAGAVVAACVILDLEGPPIAGLNDSKQVPAERREELYLEIRARARAVGVGECGPGEIDRLNIFHASLLAMRRAYTDMGAAPALILVDGKHTIPRMDLPQRALVKGDALSASVAAASIVAKVIRDRQMLDLHALHPEYGFADHKGYATSAHREAILRHGLTSHHRRSFCHGLAGQGDLFTPAPDAG